MDLRAFRTWLAGLPPASPTAGQWVEIMHRAAAIRRDPEDGLFLNVAHEPGGFVTRVERHHERDAI